MIKKRWLKMSIELEIGIIVLLVLVVFIQYNTLVKLKMKVKQAIYNEAVDYYRQRPDEYCEDIIGIKLNVYQKIMLRCIFKYDYIMFIMCRPWAW